MLRRRRKIRMHLMDERDSQLPSIEGMLVRRWPEYEIAVPRLLFAAGANPSDLESRSVLVPRQRVAFYERL